MSDLANKPFLFQKGHVPAATKKFKHIRIALEEVWLAPAPDHGNSYAGKQQRSKLVETCEKLYALINEVLDDVKDDKSNGGKGYGITIKMDVIEGLGRTMEKIANRLEGPVGSGDVEDTKESKVYISGGQVTKTEEVLTIKETQEGVQDEG